MGLVGLVGAFLLLGKAAFGLARVTPYGTVGSYELSVLPLFILMGMFAAESGIAVSLYKAAQKWLGWLRGGLLLATTLSIGLFGACCGSSVAATFPLSPLSPKLSASKITSTSPGPNGPVKG
ncbi:TRAP transporter large permease subunit [Thermodesulfobacteriota bacterium]